MDCAVVQAMTSLQFFEGGQQVLIASSRQIPAVEIFRTGADRHGTVDA